MRGRESQLATLVVVLLTAFAIRVFLLERSPLWWDEGNSVYFAHQNLRALASDTRITNDTDPPAYRLTLGVWAALAGSSPFALRLFSGWLGVLAIALTWALGRWLTGEGTPLRAGLLLALAPMQVHYAREAKGYTFAMVFALLSTYAWGRKLGYAGDNPSGRRPLWWIVYALSTAAALAAHYYLILLVLWQGLWVLCSTALAWIRHVRARREVWTGLYEWVLAATGVALLLTPWVVSVLRSTVRGVQNLGVQPTLSLWTFLERVATEIVVGPEATQSSVCLAALITLITLGTLARAKGKRNAGPFLLTWVAVPLLAGYALQRFYPFFHPRFLLYVGPACCLLVGRAIEPVGRRLSQVIAVAATLAIVAVWIPRLIRSYTAPTDAAEDPRPAIAKIQELAEPGDALVYVYIWQVGYLQSYYPQNTLSFYRAYYTPQSVGPELERAFSEHARLWLLSYRTAAEDPQNLSASWLEVHAFKVESAWYGYHNLALYLAPSLQTTGVGPDEGMASFDQRIELRYPVIDAWLRPGDVMALPLRWRALVTPQEDYTVFVHLGQAGLPPLAQCDGTPRNATSPTHTWAPGQEVLDRRVIRLPQALAPGSYLVMAGLYRSSDGSRLSIDGMEGQDFLTLGRIQVER